MENTDKISRRGFLKVSGMAGVTAALASSCGHSGEKAASEVPKGQMTYRQLPGNGDRVSLLGYGCMRWPQVKGSDGNDVIDQEAVNALVDYALEHGVNYFDTAPTYLRGFSENATGTALKRHPRDKYFIATKLSNFANPSREFAMEMYRQSFIDLQTDYIDLYYLHRVNEHVSFEEIAAAMGRLIKEGVIRAWGMSQVDVNILAKAHAVTPVAAVQNLYSMLERDCEKDIFPYCLEHNIGVVPFSPIASGFLSGKIKADTQFDDVRKLGRFHEGSLEFISCVFEISDWIEQFGMDVV